jgi:hypothetical protein
MSILNPKKILPAEQDSSLGALSRDFVWDKLIAYLSTLSAALAAVNFVTNLLNGDSASGDAACYVPEELTNGSRDHYAFVQRFCSQRLPISQYTPVFFLLQGILIGAPHFLWKSIFSNDFNYFFSLCRSLERQKDKTRYPVHNIGIIKKLKVDFSASGSWRVFWCYQFKLIIQFLLSLACLAIVIAFLILEEEEFDCPPSPDNIEDSIWPFPGTSVECIYLSHRFFLLLSYADVGVLALMLAILIVGFYWSLRSHPGELNITDAALFSYTTSLHSTYFEPSPVSSFGQRSKSLRKFCSLLPRKCCKCSQSGYGLNDQWIQNDFEFFLMLLYRVDSGLAHTFKEGLIQIEFSALTELDQLLCRQTFEEVRKGSGGRSIT